MTPRGLSRARRRATMTDVAKAAGVSEATVSHVFNNTPGRPIKASTRARVLEAARKLDYQLNLSARALSKGYSNEIVNIIPEEVESSLAVQTIAAVQERTIALGYSPTTCLQTGQSSQDWELVLRRIFARRPAGVVIGQSMMTQDLYRLAKRMGVKATVVIGLEVVDYAPTLAFPRDALTCLVAAHLLERGHRRVAYLVPHQPTPRQRVVLASDLLGLKRVLDPAGVELAELKMESSIEDARRAVGAWLRSDLRPTAIYGSRDDDCFLLLKALAERGVRVPQEVAVIGTGNSPFCTLCHPALTSADTDVAAVASRAVDIIDAIVHRRKPPAEWLIPPSPQLIVREST